MVKTLGLILLGIGLFILITQRDKISQVITAGTDSSISSPIISKVISNPVETIKRVINFNLPQQEFAFIGSGFIPVKSGQGDIFGPVF